MDDRADHRGEDDRVARAAHDGAVVERDLADDVGDAHEVAPVPHADVLVVIDEHDAPDACRRSRRTAACTSSGRSASVTGARLSGGRSLCRSARTSSSASCAAGESMISRARASTPSLCALRRRRRRAGSRRACVTCADELRGPAASDRARAPCCGSRRVCARLSAMTTAGVSVLPKIGSTRSAQQRRARLEAAAVAQVAEVVLERIVQVALQRQHRDDGEQAEDDEAAARRLRGDARDQLGERGHRRREAARGALALVERAPTAPAAPSTVADPRRHHAEAADGAELREAAEARHRQRRVGDGGAERGDGGRADGGRQARSTPPRAGSCRRAAPLRSAPAG